MPRNLPKPLLIHKITATPLQPPCQPIIVDLLIVLVAGFLSGTSCKRLGISLLVGYLVVGALIGSGALGMVTQENHELNTWQGPVRVVTVCGWNRVLNRRTGSNEP